jgi:c-di-GMP-binding flagellar brake protein YcgR
MTVSVQAAAEDHDTLRARCTVHSRSEILHLLRAIERRKLLINLDLPGSRQIVVTSLIAINEAGNALYLDIAQGDALNHELLSGNDAEFITQLEGVSISFPVGAVGFGEHDKQPVLRIAIPPALIRLQRREHFRVPLPLDRPVKCLVKPIDDDPEPVTAHIVDIGCGGVALAERSGRLGNETGRLLPDCRLLLPDHDPLVATLEVRNSAQVRQKSGAFQTRLGCRFVELPGEMATQLQRFVMNVERARHTQN